MASEKKSCHLNGLSLYSILFLPVILLASVNVKDIRIGILTDLGENDPCFQNMRILFEESLIVLSLKNTAQQLESCAAVVALCNSNTSIKSALDSLACYAENEGKCVLPYTSL